MTRPWPADDIAPYIALIDDPSHRVRDDGTYLLSETQARAILDLRLQRLTALGVKEVTDELEELAGKITDFLDILRSRTRIMAIIADELREVRELFAVPRRSEIIDWDADVEDEDLIEREDMVVTVTQGGYIKRTPLTEYRSQRRGGKGTAGHGDQGRGLRHPALRRQHPHGAARLHHRGHGLHAEDLAAAARRAQRPRQGDRQHPADPAGGLARRHPAGRRARGGLGEPADHVRHLRRRRAPQRARRLHQRQGERQDRDEAARGRAADQCPHRVGGRRRDADHQGRPGDPLPGRRTCASSRAAS